jgi:hypothetical protein
MVCGPQRGKGTGPQGLLGGPIKHADGWNIIELCTEGSWINAGKCFVGDRSGCLRHMPVYPLFRGETQDKYSSSSRLPYA